MPALRLFVEARNKTIEGGFTDNGGAIHSVERILDILSMRVRYPNLRHINNLKEDPDAEISLAAHLARGRKKAVMIEHVLPQRAYAQTFIKMIDGGATDDDILDFIRRHYRIVVLTKEETDKINKLNLSRITPDRIADAGIKLYKQGCLGE